MLTFNEIEYTYPVIQISKAQIKKLEKLVDYEIKINDDISYCIKTLIDNC